jgi:hypothetical protein
VLSGVGFFDIAALSLSSPTASATAVKVQTAESSTRRSRVCDDPTCIGARIIAQVSADLGDDPTGAGRNVGAHLSAHLSAEVNTYFSAEANMDGHADCSARAPRDAQGGLPTVTLRYCTCSILQKQSVAALITIRSKLDLKRCV